MSNRRYQRRRRNKRYSRVRALRRMLIGAVAAFSVGCIISADVVSYSGEDDTTIYSPDEVEITTSNEDVIYLSESTSDISEIDSAIETRNYIDISDSDIELIAKLLWFEARGECDDCKRRVVSVVINRMTTQSMSAYDVIYATNQFEPAANIDTSKIDDDELSKMKKIVSDVVQNGPTIPEYVTYFRADHYHNFKNQVPYTHCCNTYVSYDWMLYAEMQGGYTY